MIADPSCLKEMTKEQISSNWPNLIGSHHITSVETSLYNCVAWATGITDKWVDFYLNDDGDINIDQSADRYAEYFETLGFKRCESSNFVLGVEKIAIYEDRRMEFSHVARQIENNRWTSKMGDLEDIEHYNLEALSGRFYGNPVIFMQRPKNL